MVYQNKLVAAVKVGGKILRENGSTVLIPFGSEYSIFIKNLNSVRVQAKIWVDGVDATEGIWLVVPPHNFLDLERYIKNGNLHNGNKLKFIERTAQIEEHKGIGAEDGLVRIEYQTERVDVKIPYPEYYPVPTPYSEPWHPHYPTWPRHYRYNGTANSILRSRSLSVSNVSANNVPLSSVDVIMASCGATADCGNIGITVPGSESSQQFQHTSSFPVLAQSDVLILQLRGVVAGKKVSVPVTVDMKVNCMTCGKQNKTSMKFCSGCGTAVSVL